MAVVETAGEKSRQQVTTLSNGLTVLVESMVGVRSAAMTLLTPMGAASDPAEALGSANVLADWVTRGAGERDNRAITDYLDSLGVQRSTSAETVFMRYSASMLADKLPQVLAVYGDILLRPMLPEAGFAPARDLALQQLDAIEDEPSQKLNLLLKSRHFPDPFGRPVVGTKEHLKNLTPAGLRKDFQSRSTARGSILAVAGAVELAAVRDMVEQHFGSWRPQEPVQRPVQAAAGGLWHEQHASNQVQIGLAYDAVAESDPDSIVLQLAMNILSGGMGARLFSEIREKQGLCYAVNAGYMSLQHVGAVLGYAGTVPERAQKTLDSFLLELQRLGNGAQQDELDRAQVGMKARVIMNGESSTARAAAIAHDFYHYGRPRTLDELRLRIENVDLQRLNAFLDSHRPGKLTVVTIGPAPLAVPVDMIG
ncbi:MAG: M16 family metallopeptidase [Phycisphaerae bacterium]